MASVRDTDQEYIYIHMYIYVYTYVERWIKKKKATFFYPYPKCVNNRPLLFLFIYFFNHIFIHGLYERNYFTFK